jgi:hypothetical protein
MKKPFELLLSALALVGTGALGLYGLFLAAPAGIPGTPFQIILAAAYGLLHPLLAYSLWKVKTGMLKAGRMIIIFFLVASFFLYQVINPVILIVNALAYAYTLLYLFRPDVIAEFKEE